MRTLVIYGGRFHPFHKGHKSVYDALTKKFGADNVYVVSSGKQAPVSSPFAFEEKKKMMQLLGVPGDKIVEVKNPYMPREVTEHFDPNDTAIVFAVSEKDAERFTFAPKKDGSPSYMQPYNPKKIQPLSKHGYVMLLPTMDFSVSGRDVRSASEIRAMYLKTDDKGRAALLTNLYGPDGKKLKALFDKRLSMVETILRLSREKTWLLEDRANSVLKKARILEARIRREEFKIPR